MKLALDADQSALADAVANLFDKHGSIADLPARLDDGPLFNRDVWKMLAQMGLLGILVPEEYGGSGGTLMDAGIVLEQAGRVVLPAPYLSTAVIAVALLRRFAEAGECLAAIAAGNEVVAVAVPGRGSYWIRGDIGGRVESGRISGHYQFVPDAPVADRLLCAATDVDGRVGLYLVPAGSAQIQTLTVMDPTRSMGLVQLDGVAGTRLGGDDDLWSVIDETHDFAAVALAAEQLGGARAALESAVGYVKHRVQFDRVVGSFQAVKAKCADLAIEVESAHAAVYNALQADPGTNRGRADMSLAAAAASEIYELAATENIHLHGGIGFTWEETPHLHFRRAKASRHTFGTPAQRYHQMLNRVLAD
jgi:alkylation response protein AidB-like acyl-CoA dehydrogenase